MNSRQVPCIAIATPSALGVLALRAARPLCLLSIAASTVSAQGVPLIPDTEEDLTWWYATLGLLVLALFAAVRWAKNAKKNNPQGGNRQSRLRDDPRRAADGRRAPSAPNRAREVEWLKTNQTETPKLGHLKREPKDASARPVAKEHRSDYIELSDLEGGEVPVTEEVQQAFSDLAVSRFKRIETPGRVELLPTSDDPGLLNAIEQTKEGVEHDEEVRLLATRILAAFKTENSIVALKQAALYDISSNVRSRAVSILGDFDHETVFEAIIIASADPSRDVRAAAARALARLSIDRADAWARAAESGDEFRISRLAKAAVECEIVARSVDRLTHHDERVAYEAFVLFVLLSRSGEVGTVFEIFDAVSDTNVKLGLIQAVEASFDGRMTAGLVNIADDPNQEPTVRAAAESAARTIRAARTPEV